MTSGIQHMVKSRQNLLARASLSRSPIPLLVLTNITGPQFVIPLPALLPMAIPKSESKPSVSIIRISHCSSLKIIKTRLQISI